MKKVEIYTTQICPYCVRAKSLLAAKGVTYTEIDVSNDDELRQKMVVRAGGKRSVPQIFVGDHHVGGCDDLHALNARGELDSLLND
jgi:glutaredoxin 3